MSMLLYSLLPFAAAAAAVQSASDPTQVDSRGARNEVEAFQSAGELLAKCRNGSSYGRAYCFAYIAATTDAARAYQTWLGSNELCIPSGTSQGQLVDTYEKYLTAYPTLVDSQAASVVVTALQENYPCRQ